MSELHIQKDDNLLLTQLMKDRLLMEGQFEGAAGHWWCCVPREGGLMLKLKSHPMLISPFEIQQAWAMDMCFALNKHIHHDGKWYIAFTHPQYLPLQTLANAANVHVQNIYGRFCFIFLDKDGDPQFTSDNVDFFGDVLQCPPDKWINDCELSWQRWHHHMRDVPGKKLVAMAGYKRAQGQNPPTAKA